MNKKVMVGRFGATYGVSGWLRLISFTDPIDNILNYQPWMIHKQGQWQAVYVDESKIHSGKIIVKIVGCDNCEAARTYTNIEIAIPRHKLPNLAEDDYYWTDLEGLTVITQAGIKLGTVDHLLETGANSVLVVKGLKQHLVPYIEDIIIKVDLDRKVITVNWDSDF